MSKKKPSGSRAEKIEDTRTTDELEAEIAEESPDPRASTPPANDEDDQGRLTTIPPAAAWYGVFDHTRLRFVGGVYGSRKDAQKAAKAMGVPTAEIRPL